MRKIDIIKLHNKVLLISAYFGCEDYTPQQIKVLWKQTGMKESVVAEKTCKSIERSHEYCYGMIKGRKTRVEVARFFRRFR